VHAELILSSHLYWRYPGRQGRCTCPVATFQNGLWAGLCTFRKVVGVGHGAIG